MKPLKSSYEKNTFLFFMTFIFPGSRRLRFKRKRLKALSLIRKCALQRLQAY